MAHFFTEALSRAFRVRVQCPFVAADDSVPEPDIAIVEAGGDPRRHPDSAYLLVEVAMSSAELDRTVKAPLYARSGVSEYWIVDLEARVVEVYSDPQEGVWRVRQTRGWNEPFAPAAFPLLHVAMRDVVRV